MVLELDTIVVFVVEFVGIVFVVVVVCCLILKERQHPVSQKGRNFLLLPLLAKSVFSLSIPPPLFAFCSILFVLSIREHTALFVRVLSVSKINKKIKNE